MCSAYALCVVRCLTLVVVAMRCCCFCGSLLVVLRCCLLSFAGSRCLLLFGAVCTASFWGVVVSGCLVAVCSCWHGLFVCCVVVVRLLVVVYCLSFDDDMCGCCVSGCRWSVCGVICVC